jgi:hypothetical protein
MKRAYSKIGTAVANFSGAMEQRPLKITGGSRKAIRVDVTINII